MSEFNTETPDIMETIDDVYHRFFRGNTEENDEDVDLAKSGRHVKTANAVESVSVSQS